MSIRLWAFWRRLQYTIGFFVFCGVLGSLIYWANFYTAQWDIYAMTNPLKLEILENDM